MRNMSSLDLRSSYSSYVLTKVSSLLFKDFFRLDPEVENDATQSLFIIVALTNKDHYI